MPQPTDNQTKNAGKIAAAALIIPAIVAAGLVASTLPGSSTAPAKSTKLWCISNYIEKVPYEATPQGKPRQDPLLDNKLSWLRRDQIEAQSKDEAEKIFETKYAGFFTRSNRDELIAALQKNDENTFTHRYNAGATAEGPCEGTGEQGIDDGKWVADAQIDECGGDTGKKGPTTGDYKPVGKEFEVNITFYSPYTPGNDCDKATGGGLGSADGGFFVTSDGKIKWHKGSKVLDHIFAQPQSDNVIKWSMINHYAVLIPGFSQGAIEVHDHYGKGVHTDQSFLDLSYTCGEGGKLEKELSAIQKNQGVSQKGGEGTTVKAQIVDLDATRARGQNIIEVALNKISNYLNPAKSQTILADISAGADKPCPAHLPLPGPSFGTDYHNDVASSQQGTGQEATNRDNNSGNNTDAASSISPTGKVEGLGKTAYPGGSDEHLSFSSCHGTSLCHPGNKPGHNSIIGIRTGASNGDALDISNSSNIVYAVFDGEAKAWSGNSNNSDPKLQAVRLTSQNGQVVADYYHVVITKTGSVKAGDPIGRFYSGLKSPHIHFELMVNGKTVHGDPTKKNNEQSYQSSLWINMKNVLGLT